jgi:hypothetical protein
MRNPVDIDRKHSFAIVREIGERLNASLSQEPEVPASFGRQIDRLRESERQIGNKEAPRRK